MKENLEIFRKNKKIAYPLLGILFLLFILDLFIHKHAHYHLEGFFGFYPLFGFLACGLIIIGSKLIGKFLCKEEDYYG